MTFSGLRRLQPRRTVTLVVFGILVVAALAYGIHLWLYYQTHVSTDDAFITANIAPISAQVSGIVLEVPVNDNQQMKAGAVLVRLDPRNFEAAVAQAKAAVETAKGDLQNAILGVPYMADSTRSQVQQAEAALAAAQDGQQVATHDLQVRESDLKGQQAAAAAAAAAVQAAQADLEKARQDRERMAELLKEGYVAKQDYDHAQATYLSAQASLEAARQRLDQAKQVALQSAASVRSQQSTLAQSARRVQEARAALANAESQTQQVKIREAQVDSARGRLAQAEANLHQAELNLSYTTIRAPYDGRVTQKSVEPGQVVQPGQPLLSIVGLGEVWVLANYKETELTRVRPGDPATITVDTYPGIVFKGHVDSIQAGSGATFSLLPPENATGNYVKVVQRIPVKIVFDPGETSKRLLVPGMSAVPIIHIR
jgi:membrane fusion protein (multidrug efflux system)